MSRTRWGARWYAQRAVFGNATKQTCGIPRPISSEVSSKQTVSGFLQSSRCFTQKTGGPYETQFDLAHIIFFKQKVPNRWNIAGVSPFFVPSWILWFGIGTSWSIDRQWRHLPCGIRVASIHCKCSPENRPKVRGQPLKQQAVWEAAHRQNHSVES